MRTNWWSIIISSKNCLDSRPTEARLLPSSVYYQKWDVQMKLFKSMTRLQHKYCCYDPCAAYSKRWNTFAVGLRSYYRCHWKERDWLSVRCRKNDRNISANA